MNKRIGIIVGGGPAPGINAVIGAATIEATNRGCTVFGFYDGFSWLCSNEFDTPEHAIRLDISQVARIHFTGGSILRTSRANLLDESKLSSSTVVAPDAEKVQRVLMHLHELGIGNLLTIGGDDTALSARFVHEASQGAIRVVHVPKTIDNDLPLPHDVPTFGFATARYLGTHLVKNLMQDSQTTGRWYLATAMGRSAGWLAVALGQSAGATLTLIPEEFSENSKLQNIVDVLEGAILKRRVMGRPDGVALIAEGLAYRLGDRAELETLLGQKIRVDAAGHPRLSELPLGDLLKQEIQRRFNARGEKLPMVALTLGYELRSADPTPHDMAYGRSLGYGSVNMLLNKELYPESGTMVTLVNGNITPMSFQDMTDPKTNRTRVRLVDLLSDDYRVARAYMIRLEQSDLADRVMLAKLAAAAKMTPDEFRERFARAATPLVDDVPVEQP